MSLGTGLFLSALVLSLVILYSVTRDRWNWRRVALWGTLGPLAVLIVLAAAAYLVWRWEDRPKPLNSFFGVALRASEQDVRFMKGEPTSREPDGTWVYDIKDSSSGQIVATYRVQFRDGNVRYVFYAPGGYDPNKEYAFGFSDGTRLSQVSGKLGDPSDTSEKPDGSARLYSYRDYNAFFGFRKGVVEVYGMYDPATGPLKFTAD
ncbi:hypothetical protein [Rhizobium leguminosarum]|uniref:hypothetical protein n=1 Tax=Rhizobium leguminosarum TaxID=384 RepID=UPI001FD9523D|nr:hypothetical protein [Rhizobium leguminosarum]